VASCAEDASTATLLRTKNAGTLGAYAETSLTYLELKTSSRYLPGGTNLKTEGGSPPMGTGREVLAGIRDVYGFFSPCQSSRRKYWVSDAGNNSLDSISIPRRSPNNRRIGTELHF